MSYLLITSDDEKASVFAHCTEADAKGPLPAHSWVGAALQAVPGGRGGGKAATAQGSVMVVGGGGGGGVAVEEAVGAMRVAAEAFRVAAVQRSK